MSKLLRVLIVEDREEDAELTMRALRQSGYELDVQVVSTAATMEAALAAKSFEIVISDHCMPGFSAPAALAVLHGKGLDIPFIIVTGTMGEDQAVDAMRSGAHDYIVKGRLARLGAAVERELREAELRRSGRDAEEKLRAAEQRYRTLVEQIPAITYIAAADAARATIYISPQIEALTGYAPAQWMDRGDRWFSRVHHEDRPRVQKELLRSLESGSAFTSEYRLVDRHERAVWVRDEATVVREKADDPRYLRGFVVDITRARESEETIRRMAYHDRLTDLPNQFLLIERIKEAIEDGRRGTRPFGLLLICVHGMADINNTLGRTAGDQLLCQISNRLRERARGGISVARIAGHEFALIAPGVGAERALQLARSIVSEFERPFEIDGISLSVRVDVGVAVFPGHGQDAELLLKRADVAASNARRAKSGCELFTPEQDPYTPDRLALIGELRQAIDAGQLVLHFQPVINLAKNTISGVEALVRWQHPRRGLLMPDEFIGVAESTGLIQPLTDWVLEEAVRQCWTWQHEALPLTVSANLSTRNLQDARLPERVAGLINTWALDPARLVLEITETTVMADPARAIEVLRQLRQMGIGVGAIDDFGTGYSSLGYLRSLPVTAVKLDKSLVTGIAKNGVEGLIVQSVADLAHHLDLTVVAEGVEDARTLEMLVAAGCDSAQGYFMGRPMEIAALSKWLAESPFGFGKRRTAVATKTADEPIADPS